jgi:signal peptidase I
MNQQELSHALRKEAIRNGHAVQTLASGYSMFPFLRKGDLLTVEPVPMETIKRGDIVVFESEEKWIAHRVIKIRSNTEGLEFLLRGDTNLQFDPVVNSGKYVGAVTSYVRNEKSHYPSQFNKQSNIIIQIGIWRVLPLFIAKTFVQKGSSLFKLFTKMLNRNSRNRIEMKQ